MCSFFLSQLVIVSRCLRLAAARTGSTDLIRDGLRFLSAEGTSNARPLQSLVSLGILSVAALTPALGDDRASSELDRVAYAVDGAESSHGRDLSMWQANRAGPQGPMQVSEKAATDVGGGDRFDITQNRALGRAYLALLHRRYGNWPDAVSAYNWGLGRLDQWIRAGRPSEKLVPGVSKYVHRVMHESGLCNGTLATECRLEGSTSGTLATTAGRQRPSAFDRNLAKAQRLADQFGREAGHIR